MGAKPGEDVEEDAMSKSGGNVMEDKVVCEEVVEMEGNGDNGGGGGKVDGGGDVGVQGGRRVREASKRKPLRGKRRGKRSIRGEEDAKLASTMAR